MRHTKRECNTRHHGVDDGALIESVPVKHDRFDLVGLDADDTLWHCERAFQQATSVFFDIVSPWIRVDVDLPSLLHENEVARLDLMGFGAKSFAISMIDTAIDASDGRIPAREVQRLVHLAYEMLEAPVELFPGVTDAVASMAEHHTLVLVTKGDLLHQQRKLVSSGLAPWFDHVEIVSDKTVEVYQGFLTRQRVEPSRFVMVGDSVKSDVLPVLAIGAHAVHIPSEHRWSHEEAEHNGTVPTLASLAELPGWLATAF
jgi:putative hydrolase of the HAD superfamily